MDEKWVGFSVTSNIVIVGLHFRDDVIEVLDDDTWSLQRGDKPDAYRVVYERVLNYLRERDLQNIAIKGSIASTHSGALTHLYAAELRGVVMAAAAQVATDVRVITKSTISKSFGNRKTDEYVADDSFWRETLETQVRKGSRETALAILAARKK